VVIAQFLGNGFEGDQVMKMLKEKVGKGGMELTVRTESPLRTCTSVVASTTTTELIEASGDISSDELKELLTRLDKIKGSARSLCVMGSMPPGCPDSTYADIYQRSANPKTLCLIDSVAGLKPLLETISREDKRGPAMLKVNAAELCALASIKKSNDEVGGVKEDELVAAIQEFCAKFRQKDSQALTAIAITDGSHVAHLAVLKEVSFELFQVPVSVLPSDVTLFPIGAGDAVAAGTLAAWQSLTEGTENGAACLPDNIKASLEAFDKKVDVSDDPTTSIMLSAFNFGLACGSASCLQEQNSVVETSDVLRLFQQGTPTFLSAHSF